MRKFTVAVIVAVATAALSMLATATIGPAHVVAHPALLGSRAAAYLPAIPAVAPPTMPTSINGGAWSSGHVQGIAIDWKNGHAYWSYTTMLVKTDLNGRVIGTVTGLTGHLGDLDVNPLDGRVYGSLEYRTKQAFYIAVFDGSRITRTDMNAETSGVMTTVYLPEVVADYVADLDGDGKFAGDTAQTADHRYGASGIDGIAFGPRLGQPGGLTMLTVAYGIYPNVNRTDNDHQVLLTYDVRRWGRYARPLNQTSPHHSGPAHPADKVFVRTGNTTYGVQNLEYDRHTRRWLMSVYAGTKNGFPNYTLFAVKDSAPPQMGPLVGVPGGATGRTVPLADAGMTDPATGIRGWRGPVPVGLESLGDGRFYVVSAGTTTVNGATKHTGTAAMSRWTDNVPSPFTTATATATATSSDSTQASGPAVRTADNGQIASPRGGHR